MLVLTRKQGERLIIGDNIVVTVLGVHNGQLRLGIDAPRSISIRREELAAYPVIASEKREPVAVGTASEWE